MCLCVYVCMHVCVCVLELADRRQHLRVSASLHQSDMERGCAHWAELDPNSSLCRCLSLRAAMRLLVCSHVCIYARRPIW
jgi:hypothetical protein